MGDSIEILGFFIGFWLYLFNPSFRQAWNSEFKNGSVIEKFAKIVGAISSIVIGVVVPIVAVYYLWQ